MAKPIIINLQCTERIKTLAKKLASESGLSLSAWVRHQIITEAKRQGLGPERDTTEETV